jgi:hypothetical protein
MLGNIGKYSFLVTLIKHLCVNLNTKELCFYLIFWFMSGLPFWHVCCFAIIHDMVSKNWLKTKERQSFPFCLSV